MAPFTSGLWRFAMARPRKKARDLTTEEALRKLFPKKVVDKAKKEAETEPRKPSQEQG
jgi:hypothetical protein